VRQHVGNGRAFGTDEAKTKVGWRCEYEVSPSLANVRQLEPPMPATLSLISPEETGFDIIVFAEKKGPIEIKYVR
jgi:hypothetical protein